MRRPSATDITFLAMTVPLYEGHGLLQLQLSSSPTTPLQLKYQSPTPNPTSDRPIEHKNWIEYISLHHHSLILIFQQFPAQRASDSKEKQIFLYQIILCLALHCCFTRPCSRSSRPQPGRGYHPRRRPSSRPGPSACSGRTRRACGGRRGCRAPAGSGYRGQAR